MGRNWLQGHAGAEALGFTALPVLVVAVAALTQAHATDPAHWAVFRMAAGDGDGDTHTRLTVSLNESLGLTTHASLDSFTLCIWYYPTAFLDASTLLSYATSEMDDIIRLRLHPGEFSIVYMDDRLNDPKFFSLVAPKTWHSTCLVVEPDGWVMWMDKNVSSGAVTTKPLPADGVLVLGQEQDILDGGYSKEQSFQGHVTGLMLWPFALSSSQLLGWSSCILPDAAPLLAWNNITWTVHNQTGDISIHHNGPCDESGVAVRNLLLFTSRMTLRDAQSFLNIIGFDLVVPRDEREVMLIGRLINENLRLCPMKVRAGSGALLGINNSNMTTTTAAMMRKRLSEMDIRCLQGNCKHTVIVQDSEGTWNILSGRYKMCFVGLPRGRPVFRLRGLPRKFTEDTSLLTLSFVLTRQRGHDIYFHGFRKLHIMKDANTSRWCLNGDTLQERPCVDLERLPVGRHVWTVGQQLSGGMTLSLSTCTDHEYTCSDATCIQLAKVCDFEFDCPDKSDEVGCATALLPPDYLRSYPPLVPLPVLARVTVKRIINFNLISMTFHVNFELHLYWKDPRVTFTHLHPGQPKRVVAEGETRVWKARLVVEDAVDDTQTSSILLAKGRSEGRPTHRGYEYPGAENPIEERVDLRSTVYCKYELWWYPWDVQHCSVRLRVSNVRENGLVLNESSGVQDYPVLLEEYKVESCTLGKEEAPTSSITVYLQLSRRYEYHLFTTYLPTSLLLILGYGTLLLPVESVNERGIMSLTTLLVFISLYTETSSTLPSTAYLKYIDVWFVFSIIYLSVIIIVHLATISHRPACPPTTAWHLKIGSGKAISPSVTSRKILRAGSLILFLVLVLFSLLYFLCLFVH